MRNLPGILCRRALYAALLLTTVSALGAGTGIETIADLDALEGTVDTAWTNSAMAKIMPQGITYDNNIGVFGYADGFSSNFINSLVPITNGSVVSYSVSVAETDAATRYRYYLNATDAVVHTTTVSIAGYPESWVEDVYGEPPGWLSGTDLANWYDDRDPSRQHVSLVLISTNSISNYLAQITNAVPTWEGGGTNQNLLNLYSNDIAFVQIKNVTGGTELYVHAPTNVSVLDIYKSTNLLVTCGWTLPATLQFTTDPLLWFSAGQENNAFFTAGNPSIDTDGDGLADSREIRMFGTSAFLRDSDGDGIDDGTEILNYGLSANSADSDGDGLTDIDEIGFGTNPNSADTDGDGLTDYAELYTYFYNVDPLDADTDNDGLNDYAELVTYGTYPREADTDSDEMDGGDPTNDKEEVDAGMNPLLADTDADGIPDSYELDKGWNPTNSANAYQDADGDGFSNLTEYRWCTSPTSYDDEFPDSQVLIRRRPGINGIRGSGLHFLYTLAVNDWGTNSALIRVRPYRVGTNLVAQCLHHDQSSGIYINGTEASSLSTPINIAVSTNAVEFKITGDADAAGTLTCFELKDSNGVKNCGSAYFYVPKLNWVEFSQAKVCNYVQACYGQTTNLWIAMPQQTNDCRLYMHLSQSQTAQYGVPTLWKTKWVLATITGDGSEPSTTTLNYLDYTSAWGPWNDTKRTQGVRLNPGAHLVKVGFDMSGNGTLEAGEVHAS